MRQTYARFGAFRLAFLVTLGLLVVQYVLGMISNLEVQFPGGNAWGWVWSHSLIIQLHIYIGTLLLVVALVALVLSSVARNIVGSIAAAAGLALIILAWLSGAAFLASQQNTLSLWMALGFMGALVAYILGYSLSRSLDRKL